MHDTRLFCFVLLRSTDSQFSMFFTSCRFKATRAFDAICYNLYFYSYMFNYLVPSHFRTYYTKSRHFVIMTWCFCAGIKYTHMRKWRLGVDFCVPTDVDFLYMMCAYCTAGRNIKRQINIAHPYIDFAFPSNMYRLLFLWTTAKNYHIWCMCTSSYLKYA